MYAFSLKMRNNIWVFRTFVNIVRIIKFGHFVLRYLSDFRQAFSQNGCIYLCRTILRVRTYVHTYKSYIFEFENIVRIIIWKKLFEVYSNKNCSINILIPHPRWRRRTHAHTRICNRFERFHNDSKSNAEPCNPVEPCNSNQMHPTHAHTRTHARTQICNRFE